MKPVFLFILSLIALLAVVASGADTTTSDPSGIVNAAKGLANESDRVLFIVVLIMLLLGGVWVIRVFMKANEKKDEQLVALTKEAHESQKALAHSLDKLNESVEDNTDIMKMVKTKLQLSVALALLIMAPGCAKFRGSSVRTYEGTNVVSETVRFSGYTLFDGKATLAKAKSLQTKATLSVGVDSTEQESSGKSVVGIVKEVGEAAPNLLKKSVVPIP